MLQSMSDLNHIEEESVSSPGSEVLEEVSEEVESDRGRETVVSIEWHPADEDRDSGVRSRSSQEISIDDETYYDTPTSSRIAVGRPPSPPPPPHDTHANHDVTTTAPNGLVTFYRSPSDVVEVECEAVSREVSVITTTTIDSEGVTSLYDSDDDDDGDDDLGNGGQGSQGQRERKRKGSRWSIRNLKKQFRLVAIEDLYTRYWIRHQRLLLFKLLLILIVYSAFNLVLYNTVGNVANDESRLQISIFFSIGIVLYSVVAILVFVRAVYNRFCRVLAVVVWLLLNATIYGFMPFYVTSVTPFDNVPKVFFTIFTIHTMLPVSRRVAIVMGTITGAIDLLLVLILYENDDTALKARQLTANFIIYLTANLTGLYHMHLTDIAHRHTFLDTRKFIESDIRTSRTREKQTRMKEGLLLKVIPKYLLEDMKTVLNKRLVEVNMGSKHGAFYDLLVNKHEGTSILYADIVNFTPLTEELEPSELVKALNQLFGRFDELAKANNCLRIKILGDCYYCVSGLPDPIPDHARNCVIMGMQMILVIRRIRKETKVDTLDMRIGINSGYVLSGVLGLKKWQYDVWSDDVTIANHMESGGMPGKVHITKNTLSELKDEFKVEPGNGSLRDSYLRENEVETFFIHDNELDKLNIEPLMRTESSRTLGRSSTRSMGRPHGAISLRRRCSVADYMDDWGAEMPFDSLSDYMMERTMPEIAEVNKRLERAFHLEGKDDQGGHGFSLDQVIRSLAQLFGAPEPTHGAKTEQSSMGAGDTRRERIANTTKEIDAITLRFKNPVFEGQYVNQKDSTFKFYVACGFCIFLLMVVVQLIILTRSSIVLLSLSVGCSLFTLLIILTTGLKCTLCFPRLPRVSQRHLRKMSDTLVSNRWCKIILSMLSAAMIFVASILPVADCQWLNASFNLTTRGSDNINAQTVAPSSSTPGFLNETNSGELKPCLFAPYYLYSCMLALVSCSVFLRVSYIVKMCYMLVGLAISNIMFYDVFYHVFAIYDQYIESDYISTSVRGTLYTTVLFVALVVLDRQIEKNLRWDFLCKTKIKKDAQEVEKNEVLNELLLSNMLPRHVANHFIRQRRERKNELYHQQCKNTSVMFAAIPNFKAFYSESVEVSGPECLRLLNEIISSFDTMLIMRQFDGVEKVKTIGSTYMAAAGLDAQDDSKEDPARAAENIKLITAFAFAMMNKLEEISKDAFFDYKLRIGINHGEVIAGVVGASKPQYDIWGDTVNVASRMESNGVVGKIQVRQETAMIMMKHSIPCDHRATLQIKGKGPMRVYVVSEAANTYQRMESIHAIDVLYR